MNYFPVSARKDGESYVEVIIGVLTAIMLLLLIVFVIILLISRRHKLQGSPTLLRNPFGVTINMKVNPKVRSIINYLHLYFLSLLQVSLNSISFWYKGFVDFQTLFLIERRNCKSLNPEIRLIENNARNIFHKSIYTINIM